MDTKPTYAAGGHKLLDKRLIPNHARNVKALRKGAKLSKKTFHQSRPASRRQTQEVPTGAALTSTSKHTRGLIARLMTAATLPFMGTTAKSA